ncbi:thiolase family protein [Clostridium aminobutyricum]|uniref:Acetyl-CoA acetyltransferase n=1 Tax=Clostridium aminobutyricum TaxID=33953 RepID=A0A939IJC1_CLOAM|nr:thiolase family protein [Clostridium aminobutyricum]MBN7773951.1 thiolase family protein [Clostridium aminobutyricum]
MREAVIVAAVRTPIGKYAGMLSDFEGYELGGMVVKEAVKRAGIDPSQIEEVYMGNAEGAPGNLGRVIALEAGLPVTVPGIQLDRQCASGLETICMAAAMIESGHGNIYVAGGAESQTNNPYFMTKTKRPYSYSYPSFNYVMMSPPKIGNPDMGITAENVLKEHPVTREKMDQFAYESHQKAIAAIKRGEFAEQILPVIKKAKGKEVTLDTDESPREDTSLEQLASLKPIFVKDGSVTAGNSCPMNDGAAAVVMMSKEKADELGLKPLLKVKGFASVGLTPHTMGFGPIGAVRKVLKKTGISLDEVEMIELNEAFASQAIACIEELGLNPARVNPNGGAIALGHALGATGAVLTTKVAYAMQKAERKYAIVTMCVGGGEGSAAVFEKI